MKSLVLLTLLPILGGITLSAQYYNEVGEQIQCSCEYYKAHQPKEFNCYSYNKNILCSLTCANGVLEGEHTSYYESGALRSKSFYKNGNLEGENINYYISGVIASKLYYKNGNLEGEYLSYYASGVMESKSFYKNGKREGAFISYYPSGVIEGKSFYKNGKLQGKTISFYESDNIRE